MKSLKIKLDTKTIEVKQLPLRRYSELLGAIQELPKNIKGIQGLSNDQIFEQLPALISKSVPDLIAILNIATQIPKEELEEMGLAEATKLLVAVIEVNDYKEVFEQIKKVTASPKTKKE